MIKENCRKKRTQRGTQGHHIQEGHQREESQNHMEFISKQKHHSAEEKKNMEIGVMPRKELKATQINVK